MFQKHFSHSRVRLSVLVAACGIAGIVLFVPAESPFHEEYIAVHDAYVELTFDEATLIFTGDIMLGRAVERLMEREGDVYPFAGTKKLLSDSDRTIGNFEAAVPKIHVPTPSMNLTLAAKSTTMSVLKDHGFDILSFANNHTFDFGAADFFYAKEVCTEAELVCVGSPYDATDAYYVETIGDTTVAYIMLNDSGNVLNETKALQSIKDAALISDVQIVYVHWGDEYERIHNTRQQSFAHAFIDAGADTVIGMHPHVVQDIEIYERKAIFYSLGNFIFDQYFSDDVQQGLVIEMKLTKHDLTYTLIPITNIGTLSQPHSMKEDEAASFVTELFTRNSTTQHLTGKTFSLPK